jgi:hypothetical protein
MRRYAIRKVATPVAVEGGVADGALPDRSGTEPSHSLPVYSA